MAEDFRTMLMETDHFGKEDRWFGDIQIGGWFYFSAQAGPYHAALKMSRKTRICSAFRKAGVRWRCGGEGKGTDFVKKITISTTKKGPRPNRRDPLARTHMAGKAFVRQSRRIGKRPGNDFLLTGQGGQGYVRRPDPFRNSSSPPGGPATTMVQIITGPGGRKGAQKPSGLGAACQRGPTVPDFIKASPGEKYPIEVGRRTGRIHATVQRLSIGDLESRRRGIPKHVNI